MSLDDVLWTFYTAQKKFLEYLVTFTEEILDGKPHFLCNVMCDHFNNFDLFEIKLNLFAHPFSHNIVIPLLT